MSTKNGAQDATPVQMYSRLLNLASSSLAKVSKNLYNIFVKQTRIKHELKKAKNS